MENWIADDEVLNMANASSGNYSHNFTPASLEPQDVWYWIVKAIIAILSIVGNGLVIYFIIFKRRLRATNNWFVLSLAVADLSIGLFTTLSGFLCTFHFRCDWRMQITFYNFLLFASTLNLWAMAIDRYIGIVHSLRYTSLMTTTRVVTMVSLSWFISFLAAFVRLLWSYDIRLPSVSIDRYYRVVIDIFFGVFSCVVLLIIYARILYISRKIARQSAAQLGQVIYNHETTVSKARRNSSARVLGSVVLLFLLCYSLSIYISFRLNFRICCVNRLLVTISMLMVYLNSAVNFVVYAFMKRDIHQELTRLWRSSNPTHLTVSRELSLA